MRRSVDHIGDNALQLPAGQSRVAVQRLSAEGMFVREKNGVMSLALSGINILKLHNILGARYARAYLDVGKALTAPVPTLRTP